jgi:exosome complex component RRP46
MLVLVSASLPLAATFTSTIVTISPTGKIQSYPTPTAILESSSIHVFSFSSSGDPLLAESEGEFSIDEWDKVFNLAQELCCGHVEGKNDGMMEIDGGRQSTQSFLVDTISKKVEIDLKWKEEFN